MIGRRLFVGNLPFKATEHDLRELFAPIGSVAQITRPVDRDTQQPRGFAFVEMTSPEEAERAIRRLDGVVLMGRTLQVNLARPKEDAPAHRADRSGRGRSDRHDRRREVRW